MAGAKQLEDRMKLYIGGYAQGKLNYVLQQSKLQNAVIWDGGEMPGEWKEQPEAVNHFHLWVRRLIEEKQPAEEVVKQFLEQYPDVILICDEVGNGIVPMEPLEREYRERLGRLLIVLAQDANEVWRIVCGLAQRLK
jgi:hypothetical protein